MRSFGSICEVYPMRNVDINEEISDKLLTISK